MEAEQPLEWPPQNEENQQTFKATLARLHSLIIAKLCNSRAVSPPPKTGRLDTGSTRLCIVATNFIYLFLLHGCEQLFEFGKIFDVYVFFLPRDNIVQKIFDVPVFDNPVNLIISNCSPYNSIYLRHRKTGVLS